MDRSKYFNWDKNRSTNLNIGFIIALSFAILAFNWTVDDPSNQDYKVEEEDTSEPIEVVRTAQLEKPTPPPPAIKATEMINEFEPIEFSEEPLIEKLDAIIADTKEVELKEDYSLPAPPPAPPIPKEEDYDAPFLRVEEMPRFGDCADKLVMTKNERKMCSDRAFMSYIAKQVRYPAIARENNVQGTVVVEFIVNKQGAITEAKIIRDIGGGCGQEALRVIKKMPNWTAGQQRGRNVMVKMKLPIHFRLD